MISYVKGELTEINLEYIVVENNNIGYEIKVALSLINQLPEIGSDIKIFTFLYVREDVLALYGFLSKDDLKVFKLLLGVNGIGPKGALGILSTITPNDLRYAVLSDDIKTIAKSPGIGNKTAQKLIIELKDKLKLDDIIVKTEIKGEDTSGVANEKNEAIQALVALGYSSTEAVKAVNQVEITKDMSVEDILKHSLKKISIF